MKKRTALTLIELLVVIAVVAILLALAVPSLQSGRESGQAILCSSNLKQLNLITTIYCDDNLSFPQGFCMLDECIQSPPPGGFPGNNLYDWMGQWWFHFLDIETLEADGILWCPARKKMRTSACRTLLCSNYGINYSIAKFASITQTEEFRGMPLKKSQIRQPSQTLLFTDSGYALISWRAATASIEDVFFNNPSRQSSFYLPGLAINRERTIHPDQQDDAIKGRHSRKTVHIGLADGQVCRQPAKNLLAELNEQGMAATPSAYIWSPGL